jgi:hypothetical protein
MAALPSIGRPYWRHPERRKAADLPVAAEEVRVVLKDRRSTRSYQRNAASAPAASLKKQMQEMLTRSRFTTVRDLGLPAWIAARHRRPSCNLGRRSPLQEVRRMSCPAVRAPLMPRSMAGDPCRRLHWRAFQLPLGKHASRDSAEEYGTNNDRRSLPPSAAPR